MGSEKAQTISYDEAVAMLPDGERVHTFRQGGPCILGADWDRADILAALKAAPEIHLTGGVARSMHHGLAIFDKSGPLFIATKEAADVK